LQYKHLNYIKLPNSLIGLLDVFVWIIQKMDGEILKIISDWKKTMFL